MNKHFLRKAINPILLKLYKLRGILVHDSKMGCDYDEKRAFLKEIYKKIVVTDTFIETGTYLGETIEYFKNDFSKIVTIELSNEFYLKAVERFNTDSHIQLIQGDSGEKIKNIVAGLQKSSIFWLDGHYSYKNTALGSKETPILEELESILSSPLNHLITIDDARLFIGTHSYPTIFRLYKFVKKMKPNYYMHIKKDIIVLTDSKTL